MRSVEGGLGLPGGQVEVSIVYCSAGVHGTALSLLPKGIAKLEDVAAHDSCQGLDEEDHGHAGGEVIAVVTKPLHQNFDMVLGVNV
jgi:hypothetical protein